MRGRYRLLNLLRSRSSALRPSRRKGRVCSARGLTLVAPTKYYGYVEEGKDAPPTSEKRHIEQVKDRFYSQLGNAPMPLSDANFTTYGCSSTPTLAIVNKQGVVSWYHPGSATEAELIREIEKVL